MHRFDNAVTLNWSPKFMSFIARFCFLCVYYACKGLSSKMLRLGRSFQLNVLYVELRRFSNDGTRPRSWAAAARQM